MSFLESFIEGFHCIDDARPHRGQGESASTYILSTPDKGCASGGEVQSAIPDPNAIAWIADCIPQRDAVSLEVP